MSKVTWHLQLVIDVGRTHLAVLIVSMREIENAGFENCCALRSQGCIFFWGGHIQSTRMARATQTKEQMALQL